MSRLFGAELRRALHRRMTAAILLFMVVATGLVLWGGHQRMQEMGGNRAGATAAYTSIHEDWKKNHVAQEKECQASMPPEQIKAQPDMCQQPEPKLEDFLPFGGSLKSLVGELVSPLQLLLIFGSFLLGASLVSAEFNSGALASWLTFVPRRTPVYVSKILAGALTGFLLAAPVVALTTVGVLVLAHSADVPLTGGTSGQGYATLGRLLVLGVLGGLAGGAFGFITRHTAAALGVAIGYLIVFEGMLASFFKGLPRWLLSTNVSAFTRHGSDYFQERCHTMSDGGMTCDQITKHVSFGPASLYLLVISAIIVLIGWVAFTRRDVN